MIYRPMSLIRPISPLAPMLRLFFIHSLRYFARHPALTALNTAGIALGVTVFLSIQIINHSALESFRASVEHRRGQSRP